MQPLAISALATTAVMIIGVASTEFLTRDIQYTATLLLLVGSTSA